MKRLAIRVKWNKSHEWWEVAGGELFAEYQHKADAVARAASEARALAAAGCRVQVVSHRQDGVIQWERTYPRSSDPRRSMG